MALRRISWSGRRAPAEDSSGLRDRAGCSVGNVDTSVSLARTHGVTGRPPAVYHLNAWTKRKGRVVQDMELHGEAMLDYLEGDEDAHCILLP